MTLILLEGVDGVGKTTFAQRLRGAFPQPHQVEVRHCGPLDRDPLDAYEQPLLSYRPGKPRHVIYDRHYLGELVYGPHFRGHSRIDEAVRLHIELFLMSRGALLIYLQQDDEVLQRRTQERGDKMVDADDISVLRRRYEETRFWDSIHTAVVTDPDGDDTRNALDCAQSLERVAVRLNPFTTYVGPTRPGVLLLGERTHHGEVAPALQPRGSTSGRYLLRHLEPYVGMPAEFQIAIANATQEDVRRLWLTLGRPSVVALGRVAAQVATEHEVPHGAVPHPQYVRRFHHAEGDAYARAIAEAATYQKDLGGWRP